MEKLNKDIIISTIRDLLFKQEENMGITMLKKETKSTIEDVRFNSGRRVGNSTKQIDKAIQLLFEGYIVKVEDHWELGRNNKMNEMLFDRILKRIRFEHSNIEQFLIRDRGKLQLAIVYREREDYIEKRGRNF